MFWVAVTFNVMAWTYAKYVHKAISAISMFMLFRQYEAGYKSYTSDDASVSAAGEERMDLIENLAVMMNVVKTTVALELLVNHGGWWAGQWDMTPPEEQEEFKAWLREDVTAKMYEKMGKEMDDKMDGDMKMGDDKKEEPKKEEDKKEEPKP